MTELEYVLSGFEEKFGRFRGKRILLHGSREYARAIIEAFDGAFHFRGLITYEDPGSDRFCGLKVFQDEDLEHLDIDMVILTERVKYAEEAYRFLHWTCERRGIALYNMYGLDECEQHRDLDRCKANSLDEWIRITAPYDVVAFETMDTVFTGLFTGNALMARRVIRDLADVLRDEGKEVWFSLRKSYPEDIQIGYLEREGLCDEARGNLIRRKNEDLSFRSFREEHPGRRILYIGIGLVNECLLPRCYGIDTYRFIPCIDEDIDEGIYLPWQEERTGTAPAGGNGRDALERRIAAKKVVSFDIFDTLLMRRTLFPEDVFSLTEQAAAEKHPEAAGFAGLRKRAEAQLRHPTIGGIYDRIAELSGWDPALVRELMETEIETERRVIVGRREMIRIMNRAADEGKKVILTSDMYLPGEILERILADNGVRGYQTILVSCEHGKAKNGGLFEELKKQAEDPGDILHIGDNAYADHEMCRQAGIESFRIRPAIEQARETGWGDALAAAQTLQERCLLGDTFSKTFNDPFFDAGEVRTDRDARLARYAASVAGPVLCGYLTWLVRRVSAGGYEKVLFFSRDGYIPLAVYEKLAERYGLPEGVYYYASRRSAFLCAADDLKTIDRMAETGKSFGLSVYGILKNIYGLPADRLSVSGEKPVHEIIRDHMPLIAEQAAACRKGYLAYSEKAGLVPGKTYAVSDFVAAGTTQNHLESFLPYRFEGLYFGIYSNAVSNGSRIEYYLRECTGTLLRSFIELEKYMSSPEPSLDRIAEDGTPVFAEEVRSESVMDDFLLVAAKAKESAEEFFDLFYSPGSVISGQLIEKMFAAEGFHGVTDEAYDDWMKVQIGKKRLIDRRSLQEKRP